MFRPEMTEEKVMEGFASGTNCCMAVFEELASLVGIDGDTAKKIATGFGGGMGHGGTCGCVAGGLMALGMKYGGSDSPRNGQLFQEKKRQFLQQFIEAHGSISCPEVLGGLNPADPVQKAEIVSRNLTRAICAPAVCDTCELLKDLIDG